MALTFDHVSHHLSILRHPIITGASSDRGDKNTEGSDSDDDVDPAVDLSRVDFGSCVAAFTINDRLMVIRTEHRSVDPCIRK